MTRIFATKLVAMIANIIAIALVAVVVSIMAINVVARTRLPDKT